MNQISDFLKEYPWENMFPKHPQTAQLVKTPGIE